jgi:IPT/TIG domain-containing protein
MGRPNSIWEYLIFPSLLHVCILVLVVFATPYLLAASGEFGVPFVGVSLSANSPTVPPGGLVQMQVFVTEPKPILKGNQGTKFSNAAGVAAPLGSVRDAALFSPAGDVSGVAVNGTSGTQIFFSSPLTSFGRTIDTPVFTIAIPVLSSATLGQTVPLILDPNSSLWLDPNSQQYPIELASGLMTVGGKLSITDVTPVWGLIPAGTTITVNGVGFLPGSKVDVNNAIVATTKYVSSNQIQITLTQDFSIEGVRVRVTNKAERATYYPYARSKAIGRSTHALVAASLPMFSHATWTSGYISPVAGGSTFTGLAVQNLNSVTASVTLQLLSGSGGLLGTKRFKLAAGTKVVRDLAEFFPGLVATGTRLHASSDQLVQLLGMLGDDALGTMQPVEASLVP